MGPGPAAHMSCQEQDMKTESGKRSRGQVEKRAQKKAKAAVVISAKSDEGSDALSEPTANLLIVKVSSNRPRRATSDVSYKEPSLKIGGKEARMAVKSDKVAECEDVAVVSTAKGMDLEKPQRRLLDFVVHDEDGKPCSIEALHEESLYFTAVVLPGDGPAERSKGWYCETVGPLTSWDISGYEPGSSPAKLWIDTELASYHCVRAASSYKKVFGLMQEKADMCVEVFRALSKPDGGNPDLTLSELVARVSRAFSKGGRLQGKRIRDVLLMHGAFVSEQLRELDNSAEEKDQIFNGLPSLSALELESASHSAGLSQSKGLTTSGAIIIKEPSAAAGSSGSGKSGPAAKESSDAAFAQQLAQEEDVKAAGRQSSQRGAGAKAKVYVKINEDEIADDYPPPAYYKAEEEEMDEYELFDDDMNDMAPEDLPRRRLEDWTLYNSDARLVPLEIVPMLSNVETDMDVFGSGVMTEDDGSGFCLEEEEDEGRLDGDGRQRVGTAEAGGSSGGSGASSSSAAEAEGSDSPAAGADAAAAGGIRIYLSAVKEWMIEFGASMVFISFRTDIAWYRLGKPAQQYLPWYKPVLTSAKLAISVITMLKAETRVSRLSFNDVIARLADEKRADKVKPASRKEVEAVERYVVVHSQIVLQQFREYPDKLVRQSAFAARLAEKMTERRHTKLKISARKKILARSVRNSNPRASMRPDATKARPMRATTTKLVQKIWKAYYEREAALAGDGERAEEEGGKEGKGMDGGGGEEELQDNDSDDEEPEAAEEKASPISDSGAVDTVMADDSKNRQVYGIDAPVKWVGKPRAAKGMAGHVYQEATIGQVSLRAGDVVAVHAGDEDEEEEEGGAKGGGGPGVLLLVEYLCKKERGEGALHGWVMKRGSETVLGNAADERELFLTHACLEVPLRCAREKLCAKRRERPWGHQHREANYDLEVAEGLAARERRARGQPLEFFYQALYAADKGAFFSLPAEIASGAGRCQACEAAALSAGAAETYMLPAGAGSGAEGKGFKWKGVEYRVGDFVYLQPDVFPAAAAAGGAASSSGSEGAGEKKGGGGNATSMKGGRNIGLRAWAIGRLTSVAASFDKKAQRELPTKIWVQRFFRPEDMGADFAYRAFIHEVYYSEVEAGLGVSALVGKCTVRRQLHELDTLEEVEEGERERGEEGQEQQGDVFICRRSCDPKTKAVRVLPAHIQLALAPPSQLAGGADKGKGKAKGKAKAVEAHPAPATAASKGKGKVVEEDTSPKKSGPEAALAGGTAGGDRKGAAKLATLDIFAGCGGLSEGLQQSGVSETKWAIEYEQPAAQAFQLNHPEADVFCDNCNVILRCMMEKGGAMRDCVSTTEADEAAAKMAPEKLGKLPMPGQVDFINGGPPCQGFSGMNRFNKRAWSKVQCEMILGFLSYADFFRPRYFLLENVRNLVSFNKGQTFRLTLASLLAMGYQVRFGVLQAGNYGVAQSRKRAFIWAAAPGERLPDWPRPRHVFASSQINITLPGGKQYSAVPDTAHGAPYRSITVRDTIGDLPPVANGANREEMEYGGAAESWFQRHIRGTERVLVDHVAKEMNELNLMRCQHIPKRPGADWRELPPIQVMLSDGKKADLIPWCLPNTAQRHNQWKGLFGRLDWHGNFPTSVTDPQPMGKVGMCFHPDQDRIVTVRECARSQGFPDHFRFAGTIQAKHRQIGNAVPPPLARALGTMLKAAICSPHAESI